MILVRTLRLTALILLFTAAAFAGDGEVTQPPAYQTGREYVVRHTQHTEISLPAAGVTQVIDTVIELRSECRRSGLASGNHDVSTTITRVKVDMRLAEASLSYDSSDPATAKSPLSDGFGDLVGHKFTVTLDGAGETVKITGLEALLKGESNPLGQQFGPAQLQQLLTGTLDLGMPAEGVAPGVQWLHEVQTPLPPAGLVRTAYRFRYSGDEPLFEQDCARFDYLGVLSLDLKTAGDEGDPATPISSDDGSVKGAMWIDKKLGFPRKNIAEIRMTVKMPDPVKKGKTLAMPVKQRVEMELISTRKLGLLEN